MKILIMKVRLCPEGQLFNLTKSGKKLLCQFFMNGEQSGKEKTSDKVLMLLQNKLQHKDYLRLPTFQNSYLYE